MKNIFPTNTFILFVYFIFLYSNNYILSSIIPIKYIINKNKCCYFEISLGEPEQKIYFKIDLEIPITYTSSLLYHKLKSIYFVDNNFANQTFHNIELPFANISDLLKIPQNNIKLPYYNFALLANDVLEYGADSRISFAFHNDNLYNTSLIYLMKKQGYIDKQIFSIKPVTMFNDDGLIYIGGIPNHEITNKSTLICSIIKNNNNYNKWSCEIKEVLFNNKKVELKNNFFIFNYELDYNIMSNKFSQVIRETIKNNEKYNSICFTSKSNGKEINSFVCLCNIMYDFPNVILNINDYFIELKADKLFIRVDELFCSFIFKFYANETFNPNQWTLGYKFLKNYLIAFDMDNKSISLYSNTPFIYIGHIINNEYKLIIIWCIFFILSFGIFFNCIYFKFVL